MGEGEMDLEVETCLSILSYHPGMLQGKLTKKSISHLFGFPSGCPLAKSEPSDGWDEHPSDEISQKVKREGYIPLKCHESRAAQHETWMIGIQLSEGFLCFNGQIKRWHIEQDMTPF